MRIVKIIGLAAAALVLLAVVALGLAAALIKPNDYKPQIEALALKATGRTLALQGDLSLSVFPGISIGTGSAELRDDPSFGQAPFVRIEKMSASVALLPLLTGDVRIAELTLSGLKVKLAVNKAGKVNWEGQAAPKSGSGVTATPLKESGALTEKSLPPLQIATLRLKDSRITYIDMRSGKEMTLTLPEVSLDNLAPGQKSTLNVQAIYADQAARKSAALSLRSTFTLPRTLDKDTAFDLSGKLDATAFSGKGLFALHPGGRVKLSGEYSLGDLDLDPYLALVSSAGQEKNVPGAKPAPREKAAAAKDEAETAEMLRGLDLDLSLKADSVTVSRLPLRKIQAAVKGENGVITASPVTLTLADGAVNINASADAREDAVAVRADGTVKNAQAGQIVQALTGKEQLTGIVNLSWDVNGTGVAWPVLSPSLAGKAALSLTRGNAPAFQIIPEDLPGLPAMRADIAIEQLSGTWAISKGIARNNDLALKATGLSATGGGSFNIPDQVMDYRVAIQLPALPIVPATITGPLSSPRYSVDKVEFLRGTAKGILESPGKAGQGLEETGKGLGKAVEGIFKKKR